MHSKFTRTIASILTTMMTCSVIPVSTVNATKSMSANEVPLLMTYDTAPAYDIIDAYKTWEDYGLAMGNGGIGGSVFGGVLMGLGVGLLIMRGASTGGSEIVARLLERKMPHIPIGRFILLVDAVIVLISAFVFHDVYAAMYAIILLFVSSIVTDALVYGGDKGKMALIISNKEEEIAQEILVKMDRGVTKLCSKGGYSGEERHMLMCAVRPSQMYALRRLVVGIDPGAFIIVTTTDDVFGEGFKSAEKD